MIHALEVASPAQAAALNSLLSGSDITDEDKIQGVLNIYSECGVDDWARELKNKYLQTALQHLEETAVVSIRKKPLIELAAYLIQRES